MKLKKAFSLFSAVIILIAALPFGTFSAGAESFTDGYYTYGVSNGKVTISVVDTSISGDVEVPSNFWGYPVTAIGYEAFKNCKNITGITIPDSVTSIGDEAFADCKNLLSISIPYGVKKIEYRTFDCCTSLVSVTIPSSVTSIGNYAFYNCSSLENITIPESVTSIGEYAIAHCSALTTVTIPQSVTNIGDLAFTYCEKLTAINVNSNNGNYCSEDGVLFNKSKTEIVRYPCAKTNENYTIPSSVTIIGDGAFWYCPNLVNVTIPNGVTSIGDSAFDDCQKLKDITIPDSVISIGAEAFNSCKSFVSITIPNSVTSIGNSAFWWCINLTDITIPNSITSIDRDVFYWCSSLNNVTVPDSVTSIGDGAFSWCESLENITIPESVTTIGDSAFSYCTSLTDITIPDKVTIIARQTFSGCSSLTNITIPYSVTSVERKAFSDCYSLATVYYHGTPDDWEKIEIDDGNSCLTDAELIAYCSCGGQFGEWVTVTTATCAQSGVEECTCKKCGKKLSRSTPKTAHTVSDGKCTVCGTEITVLESAHPYEENCDISETAVYEGAKALTVSFSAETETENYFDKIYVYGKDDILIGEYSGTELASQVLTVEGDTVKIRLTSDGSGNYYGYKAEIVPVYGECKHGTSEWNVITKPTFESEGLKKLVCSDCGDIIEEKAIAKLIYGDANIDGEIDTLDLAELKKSLLAGRTVYSENMSCDINGDGVIDITDLIRLKKYFADPNNVKLGKTDKS